MCYIELKNDKYETSEDLKHLLQYILRLDPVPKPYYSKG